MDLVSKINCEQGAVRAVRFNKNGNYIITCGADKSVKLWNPYKKLKLQTFGGHSQEVLDADTSYDHAFICSGSADKQVFYTDVATAKIIRKYRAHAGRVNVARFNLEESNVIISGSIDGKVKFWDVRSRSYEHLQEIDDCKDSVTCIDVNQQQLLVSCLDKRVRLYDLRLGKMFCDYIGEQVTCSSLSKDDQCILVSVLDNRLMLFDKVSGELLSEYCGHVNKVYHIENCMNQGCSEILSGSEDGYVYAWNVVDSSVKYKLKHGSDRPVHSLNYHPDLNRLITAQEQFVYLWEERGKNEDADIIEIS